MKLGYPSSTLPVLKHLSTYSYKTILIALFNLRTLYWSAVSFPIGFTNILRISGDTIDSGYASAEDGEEEPLETLEILRNDPFEKKFAVKWLTGFVSCCDQWIEEGDEEEREGRVRILEEAIALLALSANMQINEALTRNFTFQTCWGGTLTIELNDEPYENDHESVGLQTWGSAFVFAKCICAQPEKFLVVTQPDVRPLTILELGAGTGLLSIVVARLLYSKMPHIDIFKIVASDFHPKVLKNLYKNVTRNFKESPHRIRIESLDWSNPPTELFGQFDVILAADVIYDSRHGQWIKSCAERMLRQTAHSVMWLIVPQRPTRTAEIEGIDSVFGGEGLQILTAETLPRSNGVGRADEDGYRLFKVGWANPSSP
ncbi:hypothetical protein Clacol_007350 [Clathrus columnatus]|uniref:Uncharacterized protein n=1 Tax=Clathrus columnatus TaxID=1419009 RepID=A0AAV5AJQ1_9AGAM|nr:hypothetical protein Clacol_007350 [Clathrus columnatus]